MDERNDVDKMDEVMLPGFRFHPTDEELVGFYLKRKVQQRPLSIELIKQLDIYKYDPWDLPKLATSGEKEWYFYCPRDRKYRNSARPNRVTGAGFWKATGTDRPIYSSEGNKCIGLKKSLVFYKGRAAKGIKTDWMMHEFRLPSLVDSMPTKRNMDRSTTSSIPANDSWAICRIFKKTSSAANRAISHSWVSTLSELTPSDELAKSSQNPQFSSQNMSLATDSICPSGIHLSYNNELQHTCSVTNPLLFSSYRPTNSFSDRPSQHPACNGDLSLTNSFSFSPLETLAIAKGPVDVSSVLFNMAPSLLGDHSGSKASESPGIFGGSQDHCNGFSLTSLPQDLQVIDGNGNGNEDDSLKHLNGTHFNDQWETVPAIGFPFSLPMNVGIDHAWKPNFVLDSSSCPTEISPSFGTTKCYT